MSGPIVPGSRNGPLNPQGFQNINSVLADSLTQRTLQSQNNLNGTRAMTFSSNRMAPSPTRGYSPTENFSSRPRGLLSGPSLLPDMTDSSFSPWDSGGRQRFSMNETEFPALGQKRTGDYGISISSGRAPNSPSQAPSRPQSISDHQFLQDNLFPSAVPGLGLPGNSSSKGYLGSLSNRNGDGTIGEFSIEREDFPALGGATGKPLTQVKDDDDGSRDYADSPVMPLGAFERVPGLIGGQLNDQSKDPKLVGLQSRPSDPVSHVQFDSTSKKLKSVPSSMLTDKHSFLGALKVLKEVIQDKRQAQALSVFDLDKDLTQMGLSFHKDNRLINRFQSPFAEMPCRVQDIDMFVPNEYLTNVHIREKLAEIKPNKYSDDLLFWMFYSNPNDKMQLLAAEQLFERNWKFHKEEKIWISRTRNIEPRVKSANYEEGTFMVWDVESWKKVPRDMKVDYAKLEPPYQSVPRQTFMDPSALNRGSLG